MKCLWCPVLVVKGTPLCREHLAQEQRRELEEWQARFWAASAVAREGFVGVQGGRHGR